MGFHPNNIGDDILSKTFKANPSAGILPFRVVMFDNVATPNYGQAGLAPIKHPATTFANGEKVLGVATGPSSLYELTPAGSLASDGAAPLTAWAALKPIAQYKAVNVRLQGVVPVLCDDSTDSTNILAGDYVCVSASTTTDISNQTVSMKGTIKKATLTNNAPAANQHIVGLSFQRIAPSANASQFCMVKLQPADF